MLDHAIKVKTKYEIVCIVILDSSSLDLWLNSTRLLYTFCVESVFFHLVLVLVMFDNSEVEFDVLHSTISMDM